MLTLLSGLPKNSAFRIVGALSVAVGVCGSANAMVSKKRRFFANSDRFKY